MKDKRIIEAYDQMLPEKGRHEKNLEQIISRLEAQESEGTRDSLAENGNGKKTMIQPIRRGRNKWVAAAIALFITAFGILFAVDSEAFTRLFSWSRIKDQPDGFMYEFHGDYAGTKLPAVTIGWLPEDFEGVEPLAGELDDDLDFSRTYETKEGRMIDINVAYMDKLRWVYIIPNPGEKLYLLEFSMGEKQAELLWDSSSASLFVFDESSGIYFLINSNVEQDEMIRIAENIRFTYK